MAIIFCPYESVLTRMQVLQRAIAEHRRTHARPQKSLEKHASLGLSKTPEDDGEFEDDAKRSTRGGATSVSTSGKRKYRRHPKVCRPHTLTCTLTVRKNTG